MTTLRRSTAVLVASTASLFLAGAMAAPASADTTGPVKGSSDATGYQRSVTGASLVDGEVVVGDKITIVNRFDRKGGWLVTKVRDVHPECLQAVPETSRWTVSGQTFSNVKGSSNYRNEVTSGVGWVQVTPAAGWQATPLVWSQDYEVACPLGELPTGGLEWATTWTGENKRKDITLGPTITVVKRGGSNTGGGAGGGEGSGGSGSLGTGSLGSLFG